MIPGPDDGLPQADEGAVAIWCCGCDIPAHQDHDAALVCQSVKNAILLATFEDTDHHTPFAAARPGDDLSYYLGPDATSATAEQCAELESNCEAARRQVEPARRIGDSDLYIRGVGVVSPPPEFDFEGASSDEMAGAIRGGIMAGRDPVTLAMELPTSTGPTPRRSAWNAIETMHQRTILDELAQILADVRHKPWLSLAEARDKILAAVLD